MNKSLLIILISLSAHFVTRAQCEGNFEIIQYDCEYLYYFYINGIDYDSENDYAFMWDFGDGNSWYGPHGIDHQYYFPGEYTLSVEVLEGDCQGEVFTTTFNVQGCTCPSSFTTRADSLYSQCARQIFHIELDALQNYNFDYNAAWDFGDGNSWTSTQGASLTKSHVYEAEGDYIVSCTYSGPGCPDAVTLSDTITVAFCNGNCIYPENWVYQNPDDCNNISISIETDWPIIWTIDSIIYEEADYNNFNAVLENGNYTVCMEVEPQDGCPLGDIQCIDFEVDCEEECFLEIESDEGEGGLFVFSADAPEDAVVFWNMGDGTTLTGGVITYNYSSPGTYEVCAFYETPECPNGMEECTTVVVEESECTELTISMTADITDTQLEIIQLILDNQDSQFQFEIPFTSINGTLEMTFCIPDGCYALTLIPMDGLFDVLDLSAEVSVDGILVATLDDLIGTEPIGFILPINSDCTVGIKQDQPELFNFDIYPNPAKETITIETRTSLKDATVEIYGSRGELVLTREISEQSSSVDIQVLSPGIYHIVLKSDSKLSSHKILIKS